MARVGAVSARGEQRPTQECTLAMHPLRVAEKGRPDARGSLRVTFMGKRAPPLHLVWSASSRPSFVWTWDSDVSTLGAELRQHTQEDLDQVNGAY